MNGGKNFHPAAATFTSKTLDAKVLDGGAVNSELSGDWFDGEHSAIEQALFKTLDLGGEANPLNAEGIERVAPGLRHPQVYIRQSVFSPSGIYTTLDTRFTSFEIVSKIASKLLILGCGKKRPYREGLKFSSSGVVRRAM